MQEISLQDHISSLDMLEGTIKHVWSESPEKAYIMANRLSKLAKSLQDQFKTWFQKYFDEYKELPAGFTCTVAEKKTFDFSVNEKWNKLNEEIKKLEDDLKNATIQWMNGKIIMNDEGEVIEPVKVNFTEVYILKQK